MSIDFPAFWLVKIQRAYGNYFLNSFYSLWIEICEYFPLSPHKSFDAIDYLEFIGHYLHYIHP